MTGRTVKLTKAGQKAAGACAGAGGQHTDSKGEVK
jgi:hypothetical protein